MYGGPAVAMEEFRNGMWAYYHAECEDCDWTGYGRWWFDKTENEYTDDVELPADGFFPKEEQR